MTDLPPRSHPDDEHLSAVLDGEGQPEDRAHIGSCPACAARLARFREVAVAVAAPVEAPDPERRAAAVAAALAVADVGRPPAEVVSLDQRRRAAAPRWLMAAAVLLLLALAVPAALRFAGDGDGDDDTAASATTALSAQDSAAGAPVAPLEEVRDAGDLGDIGADSDLPAQLGLASDRSTEEAAGATTTTAAGGDDETDAPAAESFTGTCEGSVRAGDPQLGPLLAAARARFDGDPVEVLGFRAGDDVRVYAVSVGTCELRTVQTSR